MVDEYLYSHLRSSVWYSLSVHVGFLNQSKHRISCTCGGLANQETACVLDQLELYRVPFWVQFCYIVP